jgi:hypothetical protein
MRFLGSFLCSLTRHDNNIDRDNEPKSEDNVFEELDVPFTEPELERGIRDLKRDKYTVVSLRSTSVCFRWSDYY